MADHSRLGRGLAALMGDVGDETQGGDASRKPKMPPSNPPAKHNAASMSAPTPTMITNTAPIPPPRRH